METLVFLSDAVAMVLLVLFSLRDDKSPPGTPTSGLFRFAEYKVPVKERRVPAYLQRDQPGSRLDGPG